MTNGRQPLRHRLVLPDRASLPFVVAAAVTWLTVAVEGRPRWLVMAGLVVAVVVAYRRSVRWAPILVVVAAPAWLSAVAGTQPAVLPAGPVELIVEARGQPNPGRWEPSITVVPLALVAEAVPTTWDGPAGRLHGVAVEGWSMGARYLVSTTMRPTADPTSWSGSVVRWEPFDEASAWARLVSGARRHVLATIRPSASPSRALVAGFLIGDTSGLSAVTTEDMRRAGLSHLVAVSGSNVALFIAVLFLVSGPLAWSARRRAGLGLVGLMFFVALIGPDPSVLRASVMAAIVLVAHAIGLRLAPWTVLGGAVTVLLLVDPALARSLGFQLSVGATAGVIGGSALFPGVRPRWLGSTLSASVGAQVAVAPILISAVGSVPLWSPLANVVAVPVAGLSTIVGLAGVLTSVDALVALSARLAGLVLMVAEVTAPLPQLGAWSALGVSLLMLAALVRAMRPGALVVGALALVASAVPTGSDVTGPALVALDVGQGDAVVLLGASGESVLIDGGRDGVVLLDALSRIGVDSLDLLVVTHAHDDHYGGLPSLFDRVAIGALWYSHNPDQSRDFDDFLDEARRWTRVAEPARGTHRIGSIEMEILGPMRRYASLNDHSLVTLATIADVRILLTGDVEELAQAEIAHPPAHIIKVPHHGGATSDLEWLVAGGANTAIISVGDNTFGHPDPLVIAALIDAGMTVRRTDREGDIVIPLGD